MTKKTALISVWDKTGVVELAQGLIRRGFEIVSTGDPAKVLGEHGIPVTEVSEVTCFPEMMGGRLKNMHPSIMSGIMARRENSHDLVDMARYGIDPIDIVVVNLCPFQAVAENRYARFDQLIENIDVVGPTIIRAAAQNFGDVLVLTSPEDYSAALNQLELTEGPSKAFRFYLLRRAFSYTAKYEAIIAREMAEYVRVTDDGRFERISSPPERDWSW